MPYSTIDQLRDRYGERMLVQLTDRTVPATGAIDEAAIDRAIADTDALIDGYLAGRYQLPLEATPQLLTDLAQQIVVYKLHRDVASDKVRDDYRDALSMLGRISTGQVRLGVAGVEPAASGASGVRTTDRDRPLTNESLKGFI